MTGDKHFPPMRKTIPIGKTGFSVELYQHRDGDLGVTIFDKFHGLPLQSHRHMIEALGFPVEPPGDPHG